jgi:hypothetical protein
MATPVPVPRLRPEVIAALLQIMAQQKPNLRPELERLGIGNTDTNPRLRPSPMAAAAPPAEPSPPPPMALGSSRRNMLPAMSVIGQSKFTGDAVRRMRPEIDRPVRFPQSRPTGASAERMGREEAKHPARRVMPSMPPLPDRMRQMPLPEVSGPANMGPNYKPGSVQGLARGILGDFPQMASNATPPAMDFAGPSPGAPPELQGALDQAAARKALEAALWQMMLGQPSWMKDEMNQGPTDYGNR